MMKEEPQRIEIAIIGTGFAGLGAAYQLLKAGVDQFTVFEAADEVGGTWRDNVYPGAACDVPSHLYSFSFARNPGWTRSYAGQSEILDYMKSFTERENLYEKIRFKKRVIEGRFNDEERHWTLRFSDGTEVVARIVVAGCGGLSMPKRPDIEGLDDFKGDVFHTATWDRSFVPDGKTIGVIGTGASAVQVIPELAKSAKKLVVFQRTPPWVLARPDRKITKFERWLFERSKLAELAARLFIYVRQEVPGVAFYRVPALMKVIQKLGERHLKKSVKDRDLRKTLTPDFTLGCKRILVSSDYYPALQKDHVELATSAIKKIEPSKVVLAEGEHELDALVLATGFRASESAVPFPLFGTDERELAKEWVGDGMEAYKGTTIHGYPNFFMLVGPNTGLGHNSMIYMIESQITYVVDAIQQLTKRQNMVLNVRRDAQNAYNAELQRRMGSTIWTSGCDSWYLTTTGKNTTLWPRSTLAFRKQLRRFDRDAYEEL